LFVQFSSSLSIIPETYRRELPRFWSENSVK
jgi:hypothetical protein